MEGLGLEENQAGHGAYGCVFRVTVNGRDCIAKKLHHILLQEQSLGQRERILTNFRHECHILSGLDHPNIVGFVGVHYGRDKNDISLIMERLHSDLAKFLETHRDTNIATRIHILYDVSKGLHYLHSLTLPSSIVTSLLPTSCSLRTSLPRSETWVSPGMFFFAIKETVFFMS